MPLRQRQEVQEVLRTVGVQPVERELPQIDYRNGMLTDTRCRMTCRCKGRSKTVVWGGRGNFVVLLGKS